MHWDSHWTADQAAVTTSRKQLHPRLRCVRDTGSRSRKNMIEAKTTDVREVLTADQMTGDRLSTTRRAEEKQESIMREMIGHVVRIVTIITNSGIVRPNIGNEAVMTMARDDQSIR